MLTQNVEVSTKDRVNQGGYWLRIVVREQRIGVQDFSEQA